MSSADAPARPPGEPAGPHRSGPPASRRSPAARPARSFSRPRAAATAGKANKAATKAAKQAEKASGKKSHKIRKLFLLTLLAGAAVAVVKFLKAPGQTPPPAVSGAPTYPPTTPSAATTNGAADTVSQPAAGPADTPKSEGTDKTDKGESGTGTDAQDRMAQAEKTAAVAKADDDSDVTVTGDPASGGATLRPLADTGKHAARAGSASGAELNADNKSADNKNAEGKSAEGKSAEGKSAEGKSAEGGDDQPARDFGADSRPAATNGSQPDGFPIKGSVGSMLYHTPGSAFYARSVAEVWFRTAEAAEKAGFRRPPSQRKDSHK
jgi:uncharacterized low-complexity protein